MALFVVLSGSVATSCSAYPNNASKHDNTTTAKDSVMLKALGDSIYTVLTEAKTVSASLKLKTKDNNNDSIVNVKVSKKDKYVLDFILSAPSNYVSDDTVYGKYVPNFSLTFNAAKGQSCIANFDFGLGKWNICDAKGKEIVRYDLPTTDVLRLANQLFPEYKYYNELLNLPRK
ncbi:MAG: hypothetical protein K2F69_01290 [Bacteroidaceae bacterium]|nr:hypothetical protein [Bacteroidaceae bacterium]